MERIKHEQYGRGFEDGYTEGRELAGMKVQIAVRVNFGDGNDQLLQDHFDSLSDLTPWIEAVKLEIHHEEQRRKKIREEQMANQAADGCLLGGCDD